MPDAPRENFFLGLLRDWGIAIIVVVLVMVGVNVVFAPHAPGTGGPAPDFTLVDLNGRSWTLSEVDAPLVVLNFWFTDCPPCRKEIPDLVRWHDANPDIPLLGVHTEPGTPPGVIQRVSKQLGITYPVLDDRKAQAASAYGVNTFPTTVVVRDGTIVDARVGMLDEAGLERLVAPHR